MKFYKMNKGFFLEKNLRECIVQEKVDKHKSIHLK